jgi:hypothetical protein
VQDNEGGGCHKLPTLGRRMMDENWRSGESFHTTCVSGPGPKAGCQSIPVKSFARPSVLWRAKVGRNDVETQDDCSPRSACGYQPTRHSAGLADPTIDYGVSIRRRECRRYLGARFRVAAVRTFGPASGLRERQRRWRDDWHCARREGSARWLSIAARYLQHPCSKPDLLSQATTKRRSTSLRSR